MASVNFSGTTYCGKNGVAAGIEGALSGFANIVGLGGLVSSIPGMSDTQDAQNKLQKAQQNLSSVTQQWQSVITNLQIKVTEDKESLLQTMIELNQNQQAVIDETLNEKV